MRILSISVVVSIALLVSQPVTAQLVAFTGDSPQIAFGQRPQRAHPQPLDHCGSESNKKELSGHALVRYNARKHHGMLIANSAMRRDWIKDSKRWKLLLEQDYLKNDRKSISELISDYFLESLDIWYQSPDMTDVLAHFSNEQFMAFESLMRAKNIPEGEGDWVVVERDLQKVADEDELRRAKVDVEIQRIQMRNAKLKDAKGEKPRVDYETWFLNFHPHEEIKEFYLQIADDFKDLVTYIPSIGKTVEGRDIFAIKINAKDKQGFAHEKPQIWWQGLQHAREWAGGSTVQYLTYHFLSKYGKDDLITDLLDRAEIIIVPIMNLDGYNYTWSNNRLWRKNRSENSFGSYGVDLNRNWDDHFGEGGSSSLPWSETYRGPHAASEPEVQALQNFFSTHKRMVGAIDFHCFSQLILRPEGWTSKPAPHELEHKVLGDKMAELILGVHGKKYVSEPSYSLYKTTGAASDWFYGENATKANNGKRIYSYTIELRPSDSFGRGRSGFVLPPEEIIPLGEEIAQAVEFFVDYVEVKKETLPKPRTIKTHVFANKLNDNIETHLDMALGSPSLQLPGLNLFTTIFAFQDNLQTSRQVYDTTYLDKNPFATRKNNYAIGATEICNH
ncbi:hypothetical protein BGW38_000818 [Lunasporangiospora selenospora]|uniref:Peptidase M14 domain-containing protein n=1 Tax=Lunasporangiospora selenospora TaxID=979761 RepID=A0A9P6G3W7_9FUNG|nr:hypothetical protein BGW38_000818 [Lunasporangiospora selenospora]